jgi:D-aspartate ligase
VIRSLGRAEVPVVAVISAPREHARRSRHTAATVTAPDPAERPGAYADVLLGLTDGHGQGVLIPTTDESLEAVSACRDELACRHLVACPPLDVARLFLDKLLTSEVAEKAGVDAPRTAAPATEEELERLAEDLPFPCLVKPRESYRYSRAFGVKMTKVENRAQLRDAWGRAAAVGIGTLVQELVPGPDTGGVNYNVYMVDGEPVAELTSRKLRLSPSDFGYPCAVVSDPVPEVVEPGRRLVRAIGIEGFANVEFKLDARDGRYKLMEVNGRPNMSGQLAVTCGLDFPLMGYRHLVEGTVPTPAPWTSGLYWINDGVDPRVALGRCVRGQLSVRAGIRPYAARHVFASLALRDPGPVVSRVALKARLQLARLTGGRSAGR